MDKYRSKPFNGDYWIVGIADPNNYYLEENDDNNYTAIPVTLYLQNESSTQRLMLQETFKFVKVRMLNLQQIMAILIFGVLEKLLSLLWLVKRVIIRLQFKIQIVLLYILRQKPMYLKLQWMLLQL